MVTNVTLLNDITVPSTFNLHSLGDDEVYQRLVAIEPEAQQQARVDLTFFALGESVRDNCSYMLDLLMDMVEPLSDYIQSRLSDTCHTK